MRKLLTLVMTVVFTLSLTSLVLANDKKVADPKLSEVKKEGANSQKAKKPVKTKESKKDKKVAPAK